MMNRVVEEDVYDFFESNDVIDCLIDKSNTILV